MTVPIPIFIVLGASQFVLGLAAGLWLGRRLTLRGVNQAAARAPIEAVRDPGEEAASTGMIASAARILSRMRDRGDPRAFAAAPESDRPPRTKLSPELSAACEQLRARARELEHRQRH